MKPRKKAAELIRAQFYDAIEGRYPKKNAWHYGKMELFELLDFIYGSKPTKEEEI